MSLLLKNCNYIDVVKGKSFERKSIVIDNGKIESITEGNEIDLDADRRTIDLAGCWLIPGLINMHEHQTYKRVVGSVMGNGLLKAGASLATIYAIRSSLFSLRTGVTTICELGAIDNVAWEMKKAIECGLIPGPRMFISGNPISITGGHAWELCIEADGSKDVRTAVRGLLKKGVDWIKLMASHDPVIGKSTELTVPELSTEELVAAVEEAHRMSKRVAVHAMGSTELGRCIEAGVDAIQHGAYLNKELAEAMANKSISLVPTLSSYRRTLDQRFKRGAKWITDHEKLVDAFDKGFINALSSGVNIGVGTDSVGGFVEELEIMNSLGLPIESCLQVATINGARILGEETSLGSIEVGKKADIVVTYRNPLVSLGHLREIKYVFKEGMCYLPGSLCLPNTNEELIIEDFN